MNHFSGLNHRSYAIAGAVGTTYTHPDNHNCDLYRPCEYPNPRGGICGESINCKTVADHCRVRHGIVDLGRGVPITCQWKNCWKEILRHNFLRHCREKHLFHPRT